MAGRGRVLRRGVRRGARTALRRLSPRARARLVRSVGRFAPGHVTVAVVCEPVDVPRLRDAVGSVTAQTHELLDVLVLPVGETAADGVRDALAGVEDPRLRVAGAVADPWAAVVAAATLARGRHLTLLRACDVLLPHAVTDLLVGLSSTPAARLADGRLAQFGQEDPWLQRTQAGPVGGDLRLLGRLAPVELWRRASAGPAGSAGTSAGTRWSDRDWLGSVAAARLLAEAGAATVRVGRPVYRYAHDHGTRAFGATPSPLPELAGWPERSARIEEALSVGSAGPAGLLEEWRRHVVDVELPRFLADTERASAEQWDALVRMARAAGPTARLVTSRALIHLAVTDRRGDVEALAEELLLAEGALRTRLEGDRVLLEVTSVPLPDEVRTLRPEETPLVVHVRRCRPVDPGHREGPFVADLYTRIDQVDLAFHPLQIEAYAADGTPLEVTLEPDRRAERWARQRFQSAAPGSCSVRVPAPGEVRLVVRVGALVRETSVRLDAPTAGSADGAPGLTELLIEDEAVTLTGPGGRRARLDLGRTQFGERGWLPPGVYSLDLGGAEPAAALVDRLPVEEVRAHHRVTVRLDPAGRLVVELAPPFGDREAGPYHQERLRTAYAAVARSSAAPTSPDVVYLESYAGRTATDSPAAILAELRRRHPGLEAYWGILDHSQAAAPGATPVLLRSRAHYEVLGRASLVVSNTDLDEWFVHRPDQLVVQTFHGYPSKAMGAVQWKAKDLTPAQVRAIRRRTVDTWDLITTPTPAMTRHYREQYGYTGPVSERGYPRDDLLTPGPDGGPTAAATTRRTATRHLLGIGEDRVAVLYAPTWRDHLATRPRAAEMADHLDLVAAARALGPAYVILLRGHRFHSPEALAGDPDAARIVDVTAYPEINDLILASDAAVLDYSSLRFDYALTGRPMVFLVPDLDQYAGGARGFLYPFTDSAPGPLVATTDEVVDLLRDVPGLSRGWAEEITRFNAAYHPFQDGRATERVVDEIEWLWRERTR